MSVTVRARHEYAHPLGQVWAAFSDPEFYQAKFEGIGHREVEVVSCETGENTFNIEVSRQVPVDVPAMLRSILGEWNTLLQSERWSGSPEAGWKNELEIEARGVPAALTGSMRLTASGRGCVNEVAITVRAPVPLLGGKLEKLVARDTEATLAAEYEFIRRWLARG